MKVLWLGKADESGTSNRITRAVNRHNGDLTMRCVTDHRSKCLYEEDYCIERDAEGSWPMAGGRVSAMYEDADFVMQLGDCDYRHWWKMVSFFGKHKNDPPFETVKAERRRGKKFGTRHAGSLYRDNPPRYDRWDDSCELEVRLFPMDLYRYQVNEPRAFPFVQPQEYIVASPPDLGTDLRVCSTPSNYEKKCTGAVEFAMAKLPHVYYETIQDVCYEECNVRRNTFHVLVDHLNPWHGCVGGATMEGLANGLVVVTDDRWVRYCPEVDHHIERPPTITVHSTLQLHDEVKRLADDPVYLDERRCMSVEWSKQYLTDKFTYEYYDAIFAFAAKYRP